MLHWLFTCSSKHFRFEPPAKISRQNGQFLFLWIINVRTMKGNLCLRNVLPQHSGILRVGRSEWYDNVRWVECWSMKLNHRVVSSLLKPSVQRWNLILQQTQLKSTMGKLLVPGHLKTRKYAKHLQTWLMLWLSLSKALKCSLFVTYQRMLTCNRL